MIRPTLRPLLSVLLPSVLGACGGGGTDPAVPTSVTLSPTTVSFTAVGQTQQLDVTILDQRGDPVAESAVEWVSSNGAVATVSPTGLVTATGPGSGQITAAVGQIAAVAQVSVTQSLANFEAVAGNAQAAPAGQPLPEPLVVEATDELGSPIVGLEVVFAVTQGGGSVAPATTTTGLDGRAATTWTLGPVEGAPQQVQATVKGTGRTAAFTAFAAGPPSAIEVAAGNGQSAPAGTAVPVRPAVRVADGTGRPVSGVPVEFSVESGGGSVSGAATTTDGNGLATVGSWTLGAGGVNTLTATVPGFTLQGDPALFVATVAPAGGFDIQVRHRGSPSSAQLLAFARAEVRWERVITGDLPDVAVNATAGSCGEGSPALSEQADDLIILADLSPIDGPGAVLGAAGPCFIRVPGLLPVVGQMRFDTDDLELLESNDLLEIVIRHEMGHVLGIGTLWSTQGLLADPSLSGGVDPHFTGANAIAAFDAAGGTTYPGEKVPVEDTGGLGTADSHWRESVFGAELMTGFVGFGSNPLSAITAQSLKDQGYTVNLTAVDPYVLGPELRIAGETARATLHLRDDVIRGPLYGVDASGTVVRTVRP